METRPRVRDTRTIQIAVPANGDLLTGFADALGQAAKEGYIMSDVLTLKGGNQRDPVLNGLKVTLHRLTDS